MRVDCRINTHSLKINSLSSVILVLFKSFSHWMKFFIASNCSTENFLARLDHRYITIKHIIPIDRTLKLTSFNITSKQGGIFHRKLHREYKGIYCISTSAFYIYLYYKDRELYSVFTCKSREYHGNLASSQPTSTALRLFT